MGEKYNTVLGNRKFPGLVWEYQRGVYHNNKSIIAVNFEHFSRRVKSAPTQRLTVELAWCIRDDLQTGTGTLVNTTTLNASSRNCSSQKYSCLVLFDIMISTCTQREGYLLNPPKWFFFNIFYLLLFCHYCKKKAKDK